MRLPDDGTVIHFQNPKVQAAIASNTFAIGGQAEIKELSEMLPGILTQLVSRSPHGGTGAVIVS